MNINLRWCHIENVIHFAKTFTNHCNLVTIEATIILLAVLNRTVCKELIGTKFDGFGSVRISDCNFSKIEMCNDVGKTGS